MSGAILSHLTVIGISSGDDGGQLFIMAILVWVICLILLLLFLPQGKSLLQSLKNSIFKKA
jgi:hypothetical protein